MDEIQVSKEVQVDTIALRNVKAALQQLKVEKGKIDEKYEASMAALESWERMRQAELDRVEEELGNKSGAIDVDTAEGVGDEISHVDDEEGKNMSAFMAEIDSAINRAKMATQGGS